MSLELCTTLSLLCFTVSVILLITPVFSKMLMEEISIKHLKVQIISAKKNKNGKVTITVKMPDGSYQKIYKTSDFFISEKRKFKKINIGDQCLISVFGKNQGKIGFNRLHLVDIQNF